MRAHQLGDGPIQNDYRDKMNAVMATLDEFMNGDTKGADREVGIVVLMFPFGATDGRCNFISNGAQRQDIVTLFKEMIARFEGQPAMKGRA
ncbi:hypothetical protein [Mesorhizobium sp. B263B2A]|uniref:hypothetical protein n=1 Tax=Mesorhizobium sp. B263B2A TaxID=2876669 RepID=UPI001CD08F55|nr:hypothetical protein [Mesorhizobium sp. B263B2A]MCA0032730.1 hypothetical protein [Mesorhizobium sp. B263B2A]